MTQLPRITPLAERLAWTALVTHYSEPSLVFRCASNADGIDLVEAEARQLDERSDSPLPRLEAGEIGASADLI